MSSAITSVFRTLQSAGQAIWGPIQAAASAAFNTILSIIHSVQGAIDSVVGGIQSALSWVGNLWDKISGAKSAAASIPAPASAAYGFAASPSLARSGLLAAPAPRAAATPAGPTIIVNGALDPDAVARQIENLLRGRGRRSGGLIV
jgi:phage-related minor tail protein